jgi:hypothetical protein
LLLIKVASYVVEPLRGELITEAMESAKSFGEKAEAQLLPFLPSEERAQICEKILSAFHAATRDEDNKDFLLDEIVPFLSKTQFTKMLNSSKMKLNTLVTLLPQISEPRRTAAVRKALKKARAGFVEQHMTEVIMLAPYLNADLLDDALELIWSCHDSKTRAKALVEACEIAPESHRAAVSRIAFVAAAIAANVNNNGEFLRNLAPCLTAGCLAHALRELGGISDAKMQFQDLLSRTTLWSDDLANKDLIAAFNGSKVIANDETRANVLAILYLKLAPAVRRKYANILLPELHRICRVVLAKWAAGTRETLLPNLPTLFPVILALAGNVGPAELFRAIKEIVDRWP